MRRRRRTRPCWRVGGGQRQGGGLGVPPGEQLAEPFVGQRALPAAARPPASPPRCSSPGASDEAYRVVLGPYATREQAEETGRRIGMPSFIVTAQDPPAR